MNLQKLHAPIAIAGLSHHEADIAALEKFRFPDEQELLRGGRECFKGVALLQTCNRVEVIVQGEGAMLEAFLHDLGRGGFWVLEGIPALRHLLRLAAGVESMVVGEDQILGQLKGALATSQETGTCSPIIDLCLNKAVHVGVEVRKRTHINKGAVSIGSAAVQLAEELLGSLEGKHILIVGTGEMGKLVTQALAVKNLTAIYVTNRTHERAIVLAREVGGKAVYFDDLYHYISLSDVIISCTAAPHAVIHRRQLQEAMEGRHWPLDAVHHPLIIIDIAQPRDVEEGVREMDGIHVFTIDDLRLVSENNLKSRQREAQMANEFIEEELGQFILLVNRTIAGDTIAILHTWAESIRLRERDRALGRLKGAGENVALIIDDLSRVLVKKLLVDATYSIRNSAERGEFEQADALVRAITRGESINPRSSQQEIRETTPDPDIDSG